jgi:hypothetical protein
MRLIRAYRHLFRHAPSLTTLGIVFSAFVLATIFAPSATAQCPTLDTCTIYDITFITNSGQSPSAGSFTYDSTSPQFYSFDVSYFGASYDLTSSANAPNYFPDPFTIFPCSSQSGPALGYAVMAGQCTAFNVPLEWTAFSNGIFLFQEYSTFTDQRLVQIFGQVGSPYTQIPVETGEGTFTISAAPPTSTPEPRGTPITFFASLSLVAISARKRIALGFRQAMRTSCEPPPSH